MLRRSRALFLHESRALARDPVPFIVLLAMPAVVMAFVRPAFRIVLQGEGYTTATGAEHAVPGMAVMFAFFLVGNVGFMFYKEYTWNTWERLRTTDARLIEVVVCKTAPYFLLALLQQTVLFGLGMVLFDLHISGSPVALAMIAVALSACLICFGVAIVAMSTTPHQVSAFQTLGTMVFAGLGGALTPVDVLPGWAQALAPLVPTYWAIRGYRTVILDEGSVADVALPAGVLLGFCLVLGLIAARRLRFEEQKTGWV